MTQIEMISGQKIKTFWNEDYVISNSQYIVKDDRWMAIPLLNVLLWRKVEVMVLDVDQANTRFLAALDKPMFSVPRLAVRSGRIFALLDDWRIPIWDAGAQYCYCPLHRLPLKSNC